jgi:hypothetical protein
VSRIHCLLDAAVPEDFLHFPVALTSFRQRLYQSVCPDLHVKWMRKIGGRIKMGRISFLISLISPCNALLPSTSHLVE